MYGVTTCRLFYGVIPWQLLGCSPAIHLGSQPLGPTKPEMKRKVLFNFQEFWRYFEVKPSLRTRRVAYLVILLYPSNAPFKDLGQQDMGEASRFPYLFHPSQVTVRFTFLWSLFVWLSGTSFHTWMSSYSAKIQGILELFYFSLHTSRIFSIMPFNLLPYRPPWPPFFISESQADHYAGLGILSVPWVLDVPPGKIPRDHRLP